MSTIISLGELERCTRFLIAEKSRASISAIWVLIKISESSDWIYARDLDVQLKKNTNGSYFYLDHLSEIGFIETRKLDNGQSSRFPKLQIRLHPSIHTIPKTAFDAPLVARIANDILGVAQGWPRSNPLAVLILIGVYARKLDTTNVLERFCGDAIQSNSAIEKTTTRLAKLGKIALLKAGEYRKATVHVFEVTHA